MSARFDAEELRQLEELDTVDVDGGHDSDSDDSIFRVDTDVPDERIEEVIESMLSEKGSANYKQWTELVHH